MKLYQHIRSSASYRVRIALALKGLDYDNQIVDLLAKQQLDPAYAAKNPARLVPLLEDGEARLSQSLAIIEYLEERHPEPPLLPRDAATRAHVREFALSVACDIHPLNNLRVLNHLAASGFSQEQRDEWARHWIAEGFAALETRIEHAPQRGRFCFGDTPTLADVCLIPQLVNAARVKQDLAPYPQLRRIEANCLALDAFAKTHPSALLKG